MQAVLMRAEPHGSAFADALPACYRAISQRAQFAFFAN
jgi:hypothetical protein